MAADPWGDAPTVAKAAPPVDPWGDAPAKPAATAATADPWGDPPAPKKGPKDFGDAISRAFSSVGGAVVEGVGEAVKAGGQFLDAANSALLQTAGQTGALPGLTGDVGIPLSASEQAEARATANTPQMTPYSTPAGEAITAAGVKISPKDRNTFESLLHTAGGFVVPMATGPVAPALFGVEGYGQAYDAAIAKGKTEAEAQKAGLENFAVQGGAAVAPFGEALGALAKKYGGKAVAAALQEGATGVKAFIAQGAQRAAGDAAMGGTMQAGSNVVEGNPVGQGVPEAAGGLAIAGGITHGAHEAIGLAGAKVGEALGARRAAGAQPAPAPNAYTPSDADGPIVDPNAQPAGPMPVTRAGADYAASTDWSDAAPAHDPWADAQPAVHPDLERAMGTIAKIEGGLAPDGTPKKSPAGAIGEFQIMPNTARQYMGKDFDVSTLWDPQVNRAVGQRIISHLLQKYDGDMNAVAIAYNAGDGRANQYLKAGPGTALVAVPDHNAKGGIRYDVVPSGRDESFLKPETQKYLANARRHSGDALPPAPEGFSPVTEPPKPPVDAATAAEAPPPAPPAEPEGQTLPAVIKAVEPDATPVQPERNSGASPVQDSEGDLHTARALTPDEMPPLPGVRETGKPYPANLMWKDDIGLAKQLAMDGDAEGLQSLIDHHDGKSPLPHIEATQWKPVADYARELMEKMGQPAGDTPPPVGAVGGGAATSETATPPTPKGKRPIDPAAITALAEEMPNVRPPTQDADGLRRGPTDGLDFVHGWDLAAQGLPRHAAGNGVMQTGFDAFHNRAEQSAPPPPPPHPEDPPQSKPGYGDSNTFTTKDDYAKLRAKMRDRLGPFQMNSGMDPEMFADGVRIAAYHIEAGARKFADYARAMIEDFGEGIRPYLKTFYNGLRDYPGFNADGMSTYDEVTAYGPVEHTGNPSIDTAAQADQQAARAVEDQKNFQPAAMPPAEPLHPEPEPEPSAFKVGDAVEIKPGVAPLHVRPTGRRVVSVSSPVSDEWMTLDGGEVVHVSNLQKPGEKPTLAPATTETDDGVQGPLPSDLAGSGSEPVPGAYPGRDDSGSPDGEEHGGAPASGSDAGQGAEGTERPAAGSAGDEAGGRAGVGSDAGLPAPGSSRAARRPPDANVTGENYRIEPGALAETRGPKAKALGNLAAIKLAKQINLESRPATKEEQAVLAQYVGWGGLSGAFRDADGNMRKGLEDIGAELERILTPEEHREAADSTQFAHYTAEHVIRSMWKAVEDMGFKGGHVFEPGMGVGHFLGLMPPDIAAASRYEGLELDPLTAQIAKLLYPESGVRQADLTETSIPEGTFDLAIGNPPFHDTVIRSDPKYAARGFMLHDYFFAKSMDSLRPGGLMAFVTSAGTMNKVGTKAREYLAQRAEFVGGVRLPSNAFKQNAGTEVTTDILFFKRRAEPVGAKEAEAQPWLGTVTRNLPDAYGARMDGPVNRYFSDHPEQVLGEEGFFDKLYKGRYGVHARPSDDLATDLPRALSRLPKNIMSEPETPTDHAREDFALTAEKKDGTYVVQDGRLMQAFDGKVAPVALRGKGVSGPSAADAEKIMALVPIRDALREVFAHDLAERGPEAAAARERLNAAYDAFVAKHGPINKAEFSFRRPSVVEQESARAKAREEARERGEHWREGDYDSELMLNPGTSMVDMARHRKFAREEQGEDFDEGSFNPADMPDVVIEKRPNIKPFEADPESYRLRSIEHYNDATGEAAKGDVFSRSVIRKDLEPDLRSANDGLLWSLNTLGKLDLDRVAAKMGRSKADLVAELGDGVYRDPQAPGVYHPANDYLSGDIYDKLASARAAAARDPDLARNVSALEAAIPPPLAPSEIHMTLGMPWIPAKHVDDFARDHLKIGDLKATHSPVLGSWVLGNLRGRPGSEREAWTTSRMTADQILSAALNRVPPKLYDTYRDADGSTKRVFNEVETAAAQGKYEGMVAAFQSFLEGDQERTDDLAHIYNTTQNRIALKSYDGGYLTTPGVVDGWNWRPHQTRVVARIIQDGDTYMAHAVGAGKTSAMIGAGMEMRRLGLIKKPMYAVPNHMLGQFAKEFLEQYPTARIAIADDYRFDTARRKQFMASVAMDDLDAVIITHSNFNMIPMSGAFQKQMLLEEREILRDTMEAAQKEEGKQSATVKQIAGAQKKLEQRIKKAMSGRKDDVFTFEELGADFLFMDEAHLFRKLSYATKMGQLKGLSPEGSDMAFDLYAKLRYLDARSPGRSHVLASGTPVTNTMAELYTLSRYMQPRELERRGISHFDAWASTFGERVTGIEQTADGTYKPETRFAKFVNTPELYKMVAQTMDVVTPGQLEQYVVRPKLEGGARQFHLAPRSEWLDRFQGKLAARVQAIKQRSGKAAKGDDIILSVINDGRLGAIDPRLVGAGPAEFDPHGPSKLNEMIDNVYRIWADGHGTQFYHPRMGHNGGPAFSDPAFSGPSTQMIFSNLGINESDKRPNGFTTTKWIKAELKRRGIPENEVVFIADLKTQIARQKLFNDMNEGKVRILVGSTQKMGTGVNAQRRLRAIHNLDPLWYPADDDQRNGRGIRQGNMNPEIAIHDYSTKGTYDSTMWQMMGRKARFIEQFFRGDPNLRDMEDLGEASQYEQISAMTTTDERVVELTDMKHQLDKALRQRAAHEREGSSIRGRLRDNAAKIEYHDKQMAEVQQDIAQRVETKGDAFRAKVAGKVIEKRADAAKAMTEQYEKLFPGLEPDEKSKGIKIAEIGGFPIYLRKTPFGNPSFELRHTNGETTRVGDEDTSMKGVIQSHEATLANFEKIAKYHEAQKEDANTAIASLKNQATKEFTGGEEITRLRGAIASLETQIKATADDKAKDVSAPKLPDAEPVADDGEDWGEDETPDFQRPADSAEAGEPTVREAVPDITGPGKIEGYSPKASAVLDETKAILSRLAPGAKQRPAEDLTADGEPIEGATWGRGLNTVVTWAVDGANPVHTVRHEAVHALKRMGLFADGEWNTLASTVSEQGWVDRYNIPARYPDLDANQQAEEAVAEAFADGKGRDWTNLPPLLRPMMRRLALALRQIAAAVRRIMGKNATAADIFSRMESGEIGRRATGEGSGEGVDFARRPKGYQPETEGGPEAEPEPPPASIGDNSVIAGILGKGLDDLGAKVGASMDKALSDPMRDIRDEARMFANPMSLGSERAQAAAKDFANALRLVTWEWGKVDKWLEEAFTPEQRERMWSALDEHGVIIRRGLTPGPNEGLNSLTGPERAVVEDLHARESAVFARAQRAGITDAEGLAFHAPRMVVIMDPFNGPQMVRSQSAKHAVKHGANLTSTTGQMKQRKYETVEETEAAAKRAFGEHAKVVRDIRTLALGAQRLEQAVAGRTLINKIKDFGKTAGVTTVSEDKAPGFFTMDHPSFTTWRPKLIPDPEGGLAKDGTPKMVPALDQNDQKMFESKPLYISSEFEGPLKAVLSTPSSATYKAVLGLKAKTMGLIMFSPVMHNAVIWGKAIPAAPRAILTFEIYRIGYNAKSDEGTMREAIAAGVSPIGKRYYAEQLTGIAEPPTIAPGRSWTAQFVGKIAGFHDKEWGEETKRAIDKAGDVWHNTFLWDRVADIQMGLYTIIRDREIKKGLDPLSAQRLAAHFANRYAGALPMESMGRLARGIANIVLFSRSFTFTNLGAFKDATTGLPSDVQAQINRDGGPKGLTHAQAAARSKAGQMLAIDIMLSYAGLALAAAAIAWVTGQKFQAPWDNEKGREKRFLIRYEADGTAVYGRLPTGKVGEDLQNWVTDTMGTLKSKLSPEARFAYEIAANDKGFKREVYDPYDGTPVGVMKNVGRVVGLFIANHFPEGELQGIWDYATSKPGVDRTTAALRTFLPPAGITISRGAPGGPAQGDLYAAKDEHNFQVQEARQDFMAKAKGGDIVGARKEMTALGIPGHEQNYMIKAARNPQIRLSKSAMAAFVKYASPEDQARFAKDRAAQSERMAQAAP